MKRIVNAFRKVREVVVRCLFCVYSRGIKVAREEREREIDKIVSIGYAKCVPYLLVIAFEA